MFLYFAEVTKSWNNVCYIPQPVPYNQPIFLSQPLQHLSKFSDPKKEAVGTSEMPEQKKCTARCENAKRRH